MILLVINFIPAVTPAVADPNSAFGTGLTLNSVRYAWDANPLNATSGTPQTYNLDSSAINWIMLYYKCRFVNSSSFAAGNWAWRLNVTTANMNITLASVNVVHVDGGGTVKAVLGTANPALALSTTGAKVGSITCVAPTGMAGDDAFWGIFSFTNGAMAVSSFATDFTLSFDSPAAWGQIFPGRANQQIKSFAVRRAGNY